MPRCPKHGISWQDDDLRDETVGCPMCEREGREDDDWEEIDDEQPAPAPASP